MVRREKARTTKRRIVRNSIISGQHYYRLDRKLANSLLRFGKLSMAPGDILVVSVSGFHLEGIHTMQRELAKIVPPGVVVLVKPSDIDLSVIEGSRKQAPREALQELHDELGALCPAAGDKTELASAIEAVRAEISARIEQERAA